MAKDIFHQAVRDALIQDGWTVTHDPYEIAPIMYRSKLKIDLGAEKLIAAEKLSEKIAVEVKSFLDESPIYEYHLALGQYINYQIALQRQEPERLLFLAMSQEAHEYLFSQELVQESAELAHIRLIVFDPINKIITQWRR
jgi:hypothetical protein